MTHLEQLDAEGPVDTPFLKALQAPNLAALSVDSTLSHDSAVEIARFKKLKYLYIQEPISEEDFALLHGLGIRQVISRSNAQKK